MRQYFLHRVHHEKQVGVLQDYAAKEVALDVVEWYNGMNEQLEAEARQSPLCFLAARLQKSGPKL